MIGIKAECIIEQYMNSFLKNCL